MPMLSQQAGVFEVTDRPNDGPGVDIEEASDTANARIAQDTRARSVSWFGSQERIASLM
jgi:hypothetical protein